MSEIDSQSQNRENRTRASTEKSDDEREPIGLKKCAITTHYEREKERKSFTFKTHTKRELERDDDKFFKTA